MIEPIIKSSVCCELLSAIERLEGLAALTVIISNPGRFAPNKVPTLNTPVNTNFFIVVYSPFIIFLLYLVNFHLITSLGNYYSYNLFFKSI